MGRDSAQILPVPGRGTISLHPELVEGRMVEGHRPEAKPHQETPPPGEVARTARRKGQRKESRVSGCALLRASLSAPLTSDAVPSPVGETR